MIEPLQRVKSAAELDCLRYSNAVGSAWMKTMMEAVEPGRTEADLVSIGLPVLVAGGGFPADIVAGSGNPCKPQAPRGIPSYNATRPLERGDLLRLDTVGTVRGYDCDMARSTCVGAAPTEAQLTVLEQAIEFVETLVDAVAPGRHPRGGPRRRHRLDGRPRLPAARLLRRASGRCSATSSASRSKGR